MKQENVLIKDFIQKAMSEIKSGLGSEYALDGSVQFELSVILSSSAKGGFSLRVLGLGGDIGANSDDEVVHTVAFSIRSKDDLNHQLEEELMKKFSEFLKQQEQKMIQK